MPRLRYLGKWTVLWNCMARFSAIKTDFVESTKAVDTSHIVMKFMGTNGTIGTYLLLSLPFRFQFCQVQASPFLKGSAALPLG